MLVRVISYTLIALTSSAMSLNIVSAEEAATKSLKTTAELGSIFTTGNTDTESINAKLTLAYQKNDWQTKLNLSALSSKDSDVTSAEKYGLGAQINYSSSEVSYIASVLDLQKDRFSGFDYRSTLSINYGRRLIKNDKLLWNIEAGPGYRRDQLETEDEVADEAVLRLANTVEWSVSDNAKLAQRLTSEIGESNSTIRAETSLTNQINGSLATKITYTINYVSDAPEGSEEKDSELGITLVINY